MLLLDWVAELDVCFFLVQLAELNTTQIVLSHCQTMSIRNASVIIRVLFIVWCRVRWSGETLGKKPRRLRSKDEEAGRWWNGYGKRRIKMIYNVYASCNKEPQHGDKSKLRILTKIAVLFNTCVIILFWGEWISHVATRILICQPAGNRGGSEIVVVIIIII